MYTKNNITTISSLRKNTLAVIKEVEGKNAPIIVFSHSKPMLVIMSFEWYRASTTRHVPSVKTGLDLFIDPPEDILIKKRGLDAVKLIRAERD